MADDRPRRRLTHLRTWTDPGAPRGVFVCAVLALSFALALSDGVPDRLPGVALGSAFLWALEATTVIHLSVLTLVWLLAEAWQGRSPLLTATRDRSHRRDDSCHRR